MMRRHRRFRLLGAPCCVLRRWVRCGARRESRALGAGRRRPHGSGLRVSLFRPSAGVCPRPSLLSVCLLSFISSSPANPTQAPPSPPLALSRAVRTDISARGHCACACAGEQQPGRGWACAHYLTKDLSSSSARWRCSVGPMHLRHCRGPPGAWRCAGGCACRAAG